MEEYLEIGSDAMIQAVPKASVAILPEEKIDEARKWEDKDILAQIRQKITML